MTVCIRETADGDAQGAVAIAREVMPHLPVTVETFWHRRRTIPERARQLWLVAEEEGEIVGRAEAGLNWMAGTDTGFANVAVVSRARRRGIGSTLYDRLGEHLRGLGTTRVLTMFFETPAGVAFAERRGFREVRGEVPSAVDPRQVDLAAPAVDVVPARDLPPEQIHAVDQTASRDVPMTERIDTMPFDEWLDLVWNFPTFTPDGSFAVVEDGRAVAVSLIFADLESGRAANAFTGTLREYRGRGYAVAAKLASMRWAAANGITRMATTNDETNEAMLAINRRLGYRPMGRMVEYLREGPLETPPGAS
jgi:GNAT superfamily N-acetyltransferase